MVRADDGRRTDSGAVAGRRSAEAGPKRERGPGAGGNGALSTRPKLIGPVEALV
jgi:hypothetical protein